MAHNPIEGRYTLQGTTGPADGRPAWVTPVPRSEDLVIVSMAMRPGEPGFPLVMSGLMSYRDGEFRDYGEDEVLGHFDPDHADGPSIVWTDGTDAVWVQG